MRLSKASRGFIQRRKKPHRTKASPCIRALHNSRQQHADAFSFLTIARSIEHDQLSQNQFDALCSLVFNIGCGAFQGSTLLRKLKAGETAASEFLRWNKAGGVELKGLTRRREAEMRLFLGEEGD